LSYQHQTWYNYTMHGSRSTCIDPEVKRSKVKVTHLSSALPAWDCGPVRLHRFPSYPRRVISGICDFVGVTVCHSVSVSAL